MNIRRLALALATGALATGALAGPAAAGSGPATVWVAHGIPGAAVDVCVAGNAVRTDFTFGQRFKASLPAGDYTIRVRLAAAGDCKGAVVIKQTVGLTNGLNATAVAVVKDGTPQLAIYVNDVSVPVTAGVPATITAIHEADAPEVSVWVAGALRGSNGTIPSIERGDKVGPVAVPPNVYSVWVSSTEEAHPIIGPRVVDMTPGRAYTFIAVGDAPSNFRFIVFSNPLD